MNVVSLAMYVIIDQDIFSPLPVTIPKLNQFDHLEKKYNLCKNYFFPIL